MTKDVKSIVTVSDLVDYLSYLPDSMKVFEFWESHSPGNPSAQVCVAGQYFRDEHGTTLEEEILLIGSLY